MFNKLFFPIILVVFCSIESKAQNFEGGLIGGVVGSQIDGDFLGGYNKIGPYAGAWVAHEIGQGWTLIGELRYIQKGKTKLADVEAGINSSTTRLHYLQIPVLARYRFPSDWFLEGGLGFGYLFDYSFLEGSVKLNESDYPKVDYYPLDFCFLIGVGYNINEKWAANFRFTNDILPMGDFSDAETTSLFYDGGNLFNKTIELGLIYSLGSR